MDLKRSISGRVEHNCLNLRKLRPTLLWSLHSVGLEQLGACACAGVEEAW